MYYLNSSSFLYFITAIPFVKFHTRTRKLIFIWYFKKKTKQVNITFGLYTTKFCLNSVPNDMNFQGWEVRVKLEVHKHQNRKLKFYARQLQNCTKFKFCKMQFTDFSMCIFFNNLVKYYIRKITIFSKRKVCNSSLHFHYTNCRSVADHPSLPAKKPNPSKHQNKTNNPSKRTLSWLLLW